MLYFSKLKIISVLIFTIIVSFFTISNFINIDNKLFKRNINLGLDLQGGSYLLLEIDNKPVIVQKLQNKLSSLKKFLSDNDIRSTNFKIVDDEKVSFVVDEESLDKVFSDNPLSTTKIILLLSIILKLDELTPLSLRKFFNIEILFCNF